MDNKKLHVFEVFSHSFTYGSRKIKAVSYVVVGGTLQLFDPEGNTKAMISNWEAIIDLGENGEESE